jgi:Ran GTPase-activating protein (RanGAP) involved in mRNA processing and transport
VQAPWIAQFRKIELDCPYGPNTDWEPLANSPYLGHLHELILYQGTLTPQGASRLAKENPCRRLKRLRLSLSLSDDSISRLFAGPAFTSLEELDFGGELLTLKGVQTVAAAPALKRLKSLRISNHPLPGIAKAIGKAAFWSGLQHLEVARCALGDDGLSDLINAGPSRLKTLRLDNNDITAAGIRSLAESRLLRTLDSLSLWGNAIGDAGVTALANSPNAKKLRKLNLIGCEFGLEGVQELAASPNLAGLRELNLVANGLGAKEAKVLAASPHLGNLTRLDVGSQSTAARTLLTARFGNVVSF